MKGTLGALEEFPRRRDRQSKSTVVVVTRRGGVIEPHGRGAASTRHRAAGRAARRVRLPGVAVGARRPHTLASPTAMTNRATPGRAGAGGCGTRVLDSWPRRGVVALSKSLPA